MTTTATKTKTTARTAYPADAPLTFAQTLGKHHIGVPAGVIADAPVPVLTTAQRQGDVLVAPCADAASRDGFAEVPADGLAVVRGESSTGGNAHILDAYHGPVYWRPHVPAGSDVDVRLGTLYVPTGSVAMLSHTDEHGSNGIGAGTYVVAGKREQADQIRRVAD